MLFKTYQKLLGASCLALYLMGCGGGSEPPIEMSANVRVSFKSAPKQIALLFKVRSLVEVIVLSILFQ